MSVARASRNSVLAGLFVVVCIAMGVYAVVMLSNIRESLIPKNAYTIRFSIADGAEGLDKGAMVKLGGKRVGSVVEADFSPSPGEPKSIDVRVKIDSAITLYDDAVATLNKPLLGSGSTINITTDGVPAPGRKPLKDGDALVGQLGGPGFIGPKDWAKVQNVISKVDQIATDVQPNVKPIMDDVKLTAANVREISESVKQKWPTWQKQVSDLLDQIDKERKSLDGVGQKIADGVENAKKFIATAQATLEENRQGLKDIVEDTRQLMAKAKGEGYEAVMAAIRDAREALAKVNSLLAENGPKFSDLMTDAALAAQQLKLATTEIRASPWRLLYQPTKKELENELLYNSVRQYANAVGELRYAAEALSAVTQARAARAAAGTPSTMDDETVNRLTEKLRKAFDQYQEQERAFLKRWVDTDK